MERKITQKQLVKIIKEAITDEQYNKNNQEYIVDYNLNNNEDYEYVSKISDIIWTILTEAYERLGGFKSFRSKKEMLKRANQITIGYSNNNIVAVSVYNDYLGGNKQVGIAAVKGELHQQGVNLVHLIIERNVKMWDQWYWIEASSKIEEMYIQHHGYAIPNIFVPGIFPTKTLVLNDDNYHYHRTIAGEDVEGDKMLFGFKDEELKKRIEAEFPLGFTEKINNIKKMVLKEDRYTAKISQIEAAKHIVDLFIEAYNDGVKHIGNELLIELKNNIDFIQNCIDNNICPKERIRAMKFAVEDGTEALDSFKQIKVFTIQDVIASKA